VGRRAEPSTTLQRYQCMTMTWAIFAWFALQLPLAVLVGKCMKFGLGEPERQTSAMPRRSVQPRPAYGTSAFRRQSAARPSRARKRHQAG
jgi:hypothetical protein